MCLLITRCLAVHWSMLHLHSWHPSSGSFFSRVASSSPRLMLVPVLVLTLVVMRMLILTLLQMLHLYIWRPSDVQIRESISVPEDPGDKEVYLAFKEQVPEEVLSQNPLVRKEAHQGPGPEFAPCPGDCFWYTERVSDQCGTQCTDLQCSTVLPQCTARKCWTNAVPTL